MVFLVNNHKNAPEIVRKIKCIKPSNDFPIRTINKSSPGIEPYITNEPYVRRVKIEEIKNK